MSEYKGENWENEVRSGRARRGKSLKSNRRSRSDGYRNAG